jgi:hypothetical protein
MSLPDGFQLPLIGFPACRHADGTISSSGVLDVWRMASEDSDELRSGFASVHRLDDLGNLHQALSGQVVTASDHLHAVSELAEVTSLRCVEGMPLEERNDPIQQIRATTDDVAV